MHTPVFYEIRVEGHIGDSWSSWFEGMTIRHEESGETLLSGPLVDEAALHGVLDRLHSLGLDLLLEVAEDLLEERGEQEKVWGSMVKQAIKRRKPGFSESYHGFRSFGQMLEEAQDRKAPIQSMADRVATIFVPLVTIIATGTWAFWWFSEASHAEALLHAVSVLIVACPCALGLATPTAVLAASGSAAGKGILFRGGDILDDMSKFVGHLII